MVENARDFERNFLRFVQWGSGSQMGVRKIALWVHVFFKCLQNNIVT